MLSVGLADAAERPRARIARMGRTIAGVGWRRTTAGVALALAALAGGHDSVRAQTVTGSAGTTLSPPYSLTRASVDGLAVWTRTAAGDLRGGPGEAIEIAPSFNTVTIAGNTAVCDRTVQVRDAIVGAARPKVTACGDVTDAHLAGITLLVLSSSDITALAAGDFVGLTSLKQLLLIDNQLTSLPDGVFAGLTSLEQLQLNDNQLTSLPDTVFAGLTSLEVLELDVNQLSTLPDGVFAGLTSLVRVGLSDNQLSTLPDTVFAGLTSLKTLGLSDNRLTSLPDTAFAGLTSLESLSLSHNQLTTLPDSVFARLTSLKTLNLSNNQLTSLPDGVFAGLTSPETLNLSGNTTDPLPLSVTLEKVGESGFKAVAPSGAPFELELSVSVASGEIEGDSTRIGIPAGAVESVSLGVTRTAGTTAPVTVDIDSDSLPPLPSGHSGYTLRKSESLPLEVVPRVVTTGVTLSVSPDSVGEVDGETTLTVTATLNGSALAADTAVALSVRALTADATDFTADTATLTITSGERSGTADLTLTLVDDLTVEGDETVAVEGTVAGLTVTSDTVTITDAAAVCDRTTQVRDGIVAAARPRVTDCSDVTDGHLAAIRQLNLKSKSITALAAGDLAALTSLKTLNLDANQLTSLPDTVFAGLTSLVDLTLSDNRLTSLPDTVFAGLTELVDLNLEENQLTSLPGGVFAGLTSLVTLNLSENRLTSLPDGIFAGLASLEQLFARANQLTSLPDGVFTGLTSLYQVNLSTNQLTSLPDGLFAGLATLTILNLSGNTTDPMPLVVTLEKVGESKFKAVAPTGAPFELLLRLIAVNGSIEGDTTAIKIPTGAVESLPLGVTRVAGTTAAVTVDVDSDSLPDLPIGLHLGYELQKSDSLPLEVVPRLLTTGVTLSVSPDSVGEVDGETTLTVTATLNGSALATDTAVALSVHGLTAGATDFTADTATLTISSGETSGTANLTLTPVDDLAVEEGGETVAVEGTVSGLTVTPDTVTITDDAAVCDRTTQVRDGIVAAVPGVTDCGDVTDGHLAGITSLDLASDSIATLAAGDFAGLTSLETLGLGDNQLSALPNSVVAGLTILETLDLGSNRLSALPDGVFAGLTSLETLDLGNNQLSALPDGVFAGLTSLEELDLGNNQLTSLPDGVFAGLASLETLGLSGNTTDPLPLAVTLEKVGESGFKAVAPTGAPFEFVLPVSAANGSIEGDSIRIPAGAVESVSLGVTRAAGTTAAVTVDIGSLPGLPSNHSGYALQKSESLPLEVVPGVMTTGVTLSVSPDQVGEGAGATMLTVTATLNGIALAADTTVALSVHALTADTADFAADTVTLTISSGQTSGTADLTLTPDADDVDESDETVAVEGTVSGLTVIPDTVTIVDDDTRGVAVSDTTLAVSEGDSTTYTVALESAPTDTVTIAVTVTGDADVTASPETLTFTADDWSTAQTVTVRGAADTDAADDTATISHAVNGGDYGANNVTADSVSVTVDDDEMESTGVALSVSPDRVGEGAGATTLTVTATLNGGTLAQDTAVALSVRALTADTADFAADTVTLTISSGQTSGTADLTLTPAADAVDESNETVAVEGTVAGLTVTPDTLTITDDDTRAVNVSDTVLAVSEGDSATYTVALESAPTDTVTIAVTVTGDRDVTASPETLTFTAGDWSTAQTVTVRGAADTDAVDDTATISHAVSGGDYGANNVAADSVAVTVDDDEMVTTGVTLSVSPDQVGEGAGATTLAVTATLNGGTLAQETAVALSVRGLTADTTDFTATTATLTISSGATSGTADLTLTPTADAVDEGDETVAVEGTVAGLTVTPDTVTITNDDTRGVAVSDTVLAVSEGDSATYTVALTSAPTDTVTIAVSVTGDADVTASPETLTFTADDWSTTQTVTVRAAADDDAADDTATVSHAVSGGDYGANNVAADSVAVTVDDDEIMTTGVTLSVSPDQVDEGDGATTLTVTATLNGIALAADTAVALAVRGLTADTTDFTASTGTLTISSGETSGAADLTLTPVDDLAVEGDEKVTVEGAVAGLTVTADTVTITDGGGVCDRTTQVRDGIVAGVRGVTDCKHVTDAHLAGITRLILSSDSITALAAGDFAGLASLERLALDDNQLTSLPDSIFAGLGSLEGLWLGNNQLTSLPDRVFVGLASLDRLYVRGNQLTSLPDGVFGGLASLKTLELDRNQLTSLPEEFFAALTSLGRLSLGDNQLTSLPDSVFAGLASLQQLVLQSNQLTTLPGGVFAGLASLEELDLGNNQLTSLPDGVFAGLASLKFLYVYDNQLTSLPGGVFAGLASLETLDLSGNTTDLLTLAVTLEKVGDSGFKAVAPTGAPFEFVLPVSAANGSIEGDSTAIRIPAGAVESVSLGVMRAAGTTAAVTVDIDSLPGLPSDHSGYVLEKDSSLPRTILPTETTGMTLSVSPDQVGEGAGATTLTVTAMLNGVALTADTTVALSVRGLTADTTDFTANTATLTISSGDTTGTVELTLTPTADAVDEADETVAVEGVVAGLTVTPDTVTITDDDTRGVAVSDTVLAVSEGDSATYTVALASAPTDTVTIAVTVTGDPDVTASPDTLTFTPGDWSTGQTVTIRAAADTDAADDTATVSHTVSGGDYGANNVAADPVSVTVDDDETVTTGVTLSVSPDQVGEGAGATTLTVTATLNGGTLAQDTAVALSVRAVTADTTDFTATTATLTISSGDTTGTVDLTLTPTDDDVDEADETVAVEGTVAGLTVTPDTVTIADDDTRGVAVSDTVLAVSEGDSATYTVALESAPTDTVTIAVSVTGDPDVTASPDTLTFTPGDWSTAQTVTIRAAADDDAADDTATISHAVIGGDYGAHNVAADSVSVTVNDDEMATTGVTLSVSPDQVGEGAGATTLTVTATLNGVALASDTTVALRVRGLTADTTDFTATTATLTISSGDTSGTVDLTLTPADDDVDEDDETVAVEGVVAGLTVTPDTVTIVDDDARAVNVSDTVLAFSEGDSATYTLALESAPTDTVTIAVSVTGDPDVTASPDTLTFTPGDWSTGQTVTIRAAADDDAADDTATVSHQVSGGDYGVHNVAADSVSVTVDDDEMVTTGVTLSVSPDQVGEGAGATTLTVTATLNGVALASDTTVALRVRGLTADTTDFTANTATLTISSGATSGTADLTLTPADDDVDEDDETVAVEGVVSGLTVTPDTVTIVDDDTRAVNVSDTVLAFSEGDSATYTLALESAPTDTVTIAVSVTGDPDVTASPDTLTFTPGDWSTAQTVTIRAAADDDAADDTATISHAVIGGDYGAHNVAADSVSVTVNDDEMATTGVTLSVSPDQVGEGAGATTLTVTATLNGVALASDTTVALRVRGLTADTTDFTANTATLTISSGATSGMADFTLTPDADAVDEDDETVAVEGVVSGLTVTPDTVTIVDDDTRAVNVSDTVLAVSEGDSATYRLALESAPTDTVTIAVSVTGDPDVTASPDTLTFTAADWSTAQTVSVSAASDADATDDTATVSHTVVGGDYGANNVAADPVSVTVDDDEMVTTGVTLSVSPDQVGEGAGATALTVTATLNGIALAADTAVALSVRALTADTTDFAADTVTLTISSGETSGTVELTLTPAADAVDEDDETVAVEGTVSGLTVTPDTVTITDDDTRGVAVSDTVLAVSEGDSATYTLALESAPTDTVTIAVTVTGDPDVTASPDTLTFTPGDWSTAQTVTVRAAADDDAADDTATMSHQVSGGDYGTNNVAADSVAVTVDDDEMVTTGVTLSVSPDQVGEGAGATTLTVTATLNGIALAADTAVALSVRALTADTTDFTATTATLTISSGDTTGTVELTLTPAADAVDEDDETVAVEGVVAGLTVTPDTVTITDDDTRGVAVSDTVLAVSEGDSATYTVALESAPTDTVTIAVTVTGDPDVTTSPDTLTFTPGDWSTAQTVTIRAAADDDAADDTATVSHQVSGGDYGTNNVAADSVAVTVDDDEMVTTGVTLSVSPDQVGEEAGATTLTVTATLNGIALTADTAVALSVRGLTADTTDFAADTATLTISSGETSGTVDLTLTPAADAVDEDDETVAVEGVVAGLTVTPDTVTITDDDTRGVAVSDTVLAVSEGDSATYRVALESAPTDTVTIAVTVTGDPDVTASPDTLTFTPGDWSTAQTVTVRAAADDDAADDTATISHSVSGGDYGANSVVADSVSVTVADDEMVTTGVTLSVSPDQVGEGAGATTLTVTATLNGIALAADTTVALSVRGLTADTTDFAADTATLTISSGETSGTVDLTLTPAADAVDEDDETVAVEGTVSGLTVTPDTVTITDDDTRGVAVSDTVLAVSEGDSATYTLALESAPTDTVTIAVTVTGDADVTASPDTLTFTPGDWRTAQTVTVRAAADGDAADDTATISHSVSGGDYGANDVAADPMSVTVDDDEMVTTGVTLSVSPDQVGEGAGATTLTVTATLNGIALAQDTAVALSVRALTADTTDFAADTATLTISSGDTSGTVDLTLTPADDDVDEDDETVAVEGVVAGLTVTPDTVTIVDDDTRAVNVSDTVLAFSEGDSATYTVALESAPTDTVTIAVTVTGDADVTASPDTLTFTPGDWSTGQTVTIRAAADADAADDTATVSHQVSGGDYGVHNVAADPVSVTVDDDEMVTTGVTLSVSPDQVGEGAGATTLTVTATLNGIALAADTTVALSVRGLTADTTDFAADTATLTISSGETSGTVDLTLTPAADAVDEDDETVAVEGTVSGLTVTPDTVTITDDDTRGVAVSDTVLAVSEGDSATYTVALESAPTDTVTIAVTVTGDADVTASPATLSFTANDWSTARTVTVRAAADTDAADDTATISHSVSGGDYGANSVAADSVAVTVDDDEMVTTGVTLSVSPDQVAEGAGATTLTVTATLNGIPLAADTAVALSVRALTADATDFAADTATLTISSGATSGTVDLTLTPAADAVDEDDETVAVEGTVAGLTVTPDTVTITDDDTRGVAVSDTVLAVSEGDSATYTVALESAPTDTVTIAVTVTGDADVTASPDTLTFTPGDWSTAQTVTVRGAADDDAADDTATISHSVSGGDYGANNVAADSVSVAVADDEMVTTGVTLSVSPDQVGEGDGATTLTVTATLNGIALAQDTAVALSVRALTADTTDFTANTVTLTISSGQTSGTADLTLTPVDDLVDEADETVAIEGSVAGLTVTPDTVTITDDDTRGVAVSDTVLAVSEGDSATYTVALASAPTDTVTIAVTVTGDADVTASPDTLTFTADDWSTAQTVTVRAAADDDAADDTATISHSVSGGDYGTNNVAADSVSVTVADNEMVTTGVTLSVSPDQVGEGAGATTLTVTATLNGIALTADTAVALSVRALTADTTDFTANTATLTISSGETTGTAGLTLTPDGDDVDEGDETVAVEGVVAGLTVTPDTVTIVDDDTRAVNVSDTALAMSEGDSTTYTVALVSAPTDTVTIAVTVTGDADVTASPDTLTFTADDWSTAQTVTVRAAADDDAADDTATISHSVSGGDYGTNNVAADSVAVTVDDGTVTTSVTLSVSPDRVGEGAGATTLTVTATLNGSALAADTAVALSVRALTADTTDFAANTATLTISSGQTSGTADLTLTPAGDDVDESDETVTIEGVVAGLTVTPDTVTIVDDDTRGVNVSDTVLAFSEGDSATYTVALESAPTDTVTIAVTVTGDPDVTASPDTLTFTADDWSTAQTVTVRAAADDDAADDAATVSHQVSGGDYGTNNVAVDSVAVTVADDETVTTGVTLSVSPDQVGEGDGATTLTVTATLNGIALAADTAVALSVRGLTADTTDFTATTATLTISSGATTGTADLTLTPDADDVDEDNETVAVEGTVSGLTVTPDTVTITDDDTRGVDVSDAALAVSEGGSATYTMALESAPTDTVTIAVTVTGDPDVTASPETLTFTAGDWSTAQTVTVRGATDTDAADDTATVSHAVSGGDYGANNVAAESVAVTVDDDGTATTGVTLSVSPDQVSEGAGATTLTVTATLNGSALAADTAVALSVRAVTANTTDFTASTATLTISSGQTSGTADLTLTPNADAVDEDHETVAVEGTVAGLTVTPDTVTITDDDTRAVDVSTAALAVSEGGSARYTVALESAPTNTVTIEVTVTGDPDVTASPETLTFTAGDWSTAQTVTVRAAADADAADDRATINHAVSGGDYGANTVAADPVAVTVDDAGGNHPATGRPHILGNAFVGATLTAVTDNIADADGLGTFEYQWWADDNPIAGATKATYEVADAERDKKIKVSVSFTDGQGNAEGPLFSVSVGPVAGLPDAPSGLRVEAGDRKVTLNWAAPGNRSHVNPYNGGSTVMRHEISVNSGSWKVIPHSGEGEENEESYVVTQLQNGREYGFQVRAVNAVGPSGASREVRITPGMGICNRTPQLRDAIMYWLSHVDGCGSVTTDDLASITNALYLGRLDITVLRRGDFDGLTSVPTLELSGNQLSSLPAGIFDDLESLTTLVLAENRLSSLPQGVFNNLAALTKLDLRENRLSSLPPRVFDRLLALEYLDLYDNNLASFPFDAINALPALSFLTLAGNPIWVAEVVVKPTALTISRGNAATYRMRLNTFPLAGTRIEPAADSSGVTVSPASVTFTRSDWFRYKDVTVSVAPGATASSATVTHTAIAYGAFAMAIPSVAIAIPASARAPATPPTAEIANTETPESGGAVAFAVTLDRAADSEVRIPYTTSHGTAAGEDYEPVTGELVLARGETRGAITVPVLDDDLHELPETFTVTLGEPDNAILAKDGATATATILDDDPSPATKAWLARFGRTVASQVLDGLGERMLESPRQSQHLTVAGYQLGPTTITADVADHARNHFKNSFNASLRPGKQGTEHDELGLLDLFTQGLPADLDRMVSTSSFHLSNVKAPEGGVGGRSGWTAWGRTASSRFASRDGELSLNGSVTSGLAGVDYEQGRLLAGLAVSHSRGAGEFGGRGSGAGRPAAATREPQSTLTGVHPYLRINLNDRLAAWGLAGYGRGESSGTERGTETGIGMNMGAFGARGSLLPSGPFGLALRTDALLAGMRADEEAGAMAIEAATSRLRFILEGSHTATLGSGNSIGTTVEVGARRDGGDAETGMGIEAGGSLRLASQKHGLKVEASGRVLLAHQDKDFEEWGVGGSVAFSPGTPDRGLSIRMSSSWGATASGVERLWSQSIADGLGGRGSGLGHVQPLTAEIHYTIGAFGDGGTLTPYANVVLAGASVRHAYRLGWRMRVGQSFNLSLERGLGGDPRNTDRNGLALRASLRP